MAESLFLMQRYHGSDDDLEELDYHENSTNRNVKKLKTYNEIECNSILNSENLNTVNCSSEIKNSKYRNRILKSKDEISESKHNDVLHTNSMDVEDKACEKKKLNKKAQPPSLSIKDSSIDTSVEKDNNQRNFFCIIGQKKSQTKEKIKSMLPKWLSNPSLIGIDLKEQEIPISQLNYLDDFSKKNLREFGITFLFPVQLSVIPWLMQANQYHPSDLCVSAPTGSGKTLAFVIPIVQSLKDRVVSSVRALVVLPVSELAIQVYKVFKAFVRGTDLNVVLMTGQKSFVAEQNALVRRGVGSTLSLADIVVTTPGRILDHIHGTEGFSLQNLKYLVIDEADRMLEEIQKGWLKQIEDAVYKDSHLSDCACLLVSGKTSVQSTACSFRYLTRPFQKLLYSATLSHNPERLHSLSLYKPKLFITKEESNECPLPEKLTLQHVICDVGSKPLVLCQLIKQHKFKKILCFTESVERTQRLHLILEEMGFLQSKEISSNYRPVQRKIILEQFSSGKIDVLVCSDLVARGIDIEDVDCVISYDVPLLPKTYIHRVGRTARAGKSGTAIALVSKEEFPNFKKLITSIGIALPTAITINVKDLEKYVEVFQSALKIADAKFKKLKHYKNKRKRKTEQKKKTALSTFPC